MDAVIILGIAVTILAMVSIGLSNRVRTLEHHVNTHLRAAHTSKLEANERYGNFRNE